MQTNAASVKTYEPPSSGRMALVASLAGLTMFAVVVTLVTLALRERLRAQIVARDASVLSSVAALEMERARALNANYAVDIGKSDEDSLLGALLDVSRLDGVVALRVFDADGNFVDAAPTNFVRGGIEKSDMASLQALKPVSHYHAQAALGTFIYEKANAAASQSKPVPLLEVLVPIYERSGNKLKGVGQFLLDGTPTALAFDQLDRNLVMQDVLALFAAFILGGGLVSWSYWKLHRTNVLLSARTKELAKANRELALRSRVSAIGAVTAHLLHGLKNPLASLSMYVEERRKNNTTGDEGLDDAGEAVRRMGTMIEESVSILGQDAGDERFNYSLSDIEAVVLNRCEKLAVERGVAIRRGACPERTVDNRRGNLLALAAVNLTQNAIEATPEGRTVLLAWTEKGAGLISLQITDSGPGLPENVARDPFKPVRSSKCTGSGVGMAIAAQLVRQMGGELSLDHTGGDGTSFSISFRPGEA
jgi:signal transduction histidine kinase